MSLYDPYAALPEVPEFTLTSTDISEGEPLALENASGVFGVEGGKDVSPQLSWSGAPEGTKSFAVTMYDPDAPTASGFWHWAVAGIPADVIELDTNAGREGGEGLPEGAFTLKNDGGTQAFLGAAPPEGHGPHRYMFVVHALDVDELPINDQVAPAILGFNMFGHTLGRARLTATYER